MKTGACHCDSDEEKELIAHGNAERILHMQ